MINSTDNSTVHKIYQNASAVKKQAPPCIGGVVGENGVPKNGWWMVHSSYAQRV